MSHGVIRSLQPRRPTNKLALLLTVAASAPLTTVAASGLRTMTTPLPAGFAGTVWRPEFTGNASRDAIDDLEAMREFAFVRLLTKETCYTAPLYNYGLRFLSLTRDERVTTALWKVAKNQGKDLSAEETRLLADALDMRFQLLETEDNGANILLQDGTLERRLKFRLQENNAEPVISERRERNEEDFVWTEAHKNWLLDTDRWEAARDKLMEEQARSNGAFEYVKIFGNFKKFWRYYQDYKMRPDVKIPPIVDHGEGAVPRFTLQNFCSEERGETKVSERKAVTGFWGQTIGWAGKKDHRIRDNARYIDQEEHVLKASDAFPICVTGQKKAKFFSRSGKQWLHIEGWRNTCMADVEKPVVNPVGRWERGETMKIELAA